MATDMIVTSVESDKLDKFLENVEENLQKVSTDIIEDLANLAYDEIYKNYSKSEYQQGSSMDFSKTGSNTEKTVSMSGPQAWYSEFGTGTRGELQSHPLKKRFNLNPYNSGETIRRASEQVAKKEKAIEAGIKEGDLYWTYKDANGVVHYTQGIPAQKEVYEAGQKVEKELESIVEKHIKEMFV